MCGIAGLITHAPGQPGQLHQQVQRMADTLQHRGPDDEGVWVDDQIGMGLGFRRLAIVDVSDLGSQPMRSPSGRYLIVFNGEIYNFQNLRQTLRAKYKVVCRGNSDTEVLLAAIDCWGVRGAIERCIGMFALALWDRDEQQLWLIRDRLGEKPLYYGFVGQDFAFASQLRAFGTLRQFTGEVDRDALALFLRYGYVPAPHSIYRGISKLPPGTMLVLSARRPQALSLGEPETYWTPRDFTSDLADDLQAQSDEAVVNQLDCLLRRTMTREMVADVPLGAFLSGGVDSSIVAALLQKYSSQPVKTFTIGFEDPAFNEAPYARAVATHLGTDHTELYVSPQQVQQVIPQLADIYDEPFADSSQIPTYLLAQLARQQVTVSLSGDGGDELFCGYPRYHTVQRHWQLAERLPRWLRAGLGRTAMRYPDNGGLGRVRRMVQQLAHTTPEAFYRTYVSAWKDPAELVLGAEEPSTAFSSSQPLPTPAAILRRAMQLDLVTYLPDDILVKVDRATMAVGLESRAPLLDHTIVQFALRLPSRYLVRNGQDKWILRQLLDRHVPRQLIERPKMGFGVPLQAWLRGALKEWAGELLDEQRLHQQGYFHPALIRQSWHEHQHGLRDWSAYLWRVLMFQGWLERRSDHGRREARAAA